MIYPCRGEEKDLELAVGSEKIVEAVENTKKILKGPTQHALLNCHMYLLVTCKQSSAPASARREILCRRRITTACPGSNNYCFTASSDNF